MNEIDSEYRKYYPRTVKRENNRLHYNHSCTFFKNIINHMRQIQMFKRFIIPYNDQNFCEIIINHNQQKLIMIFPKNLL